MTSNTNSTIDEFIDEADQKLFISKMEFQNERSNTLFRSVLAFFGVFFFVFKLYFASSQFLFPGVLQPHIGLRGIINDKLVSLLEFTSAVSFLSISIIISPQGINISKSTLNKIAMVPFFCHIISIIMWTASVGLDFWNVHIIWFCGCNILFHIVTSYASWLFYSTNQQLEEIRRHVYSYKEA